MRHSLTWKSIGEGDSEVTGCEQFRIYSYKNLPRTNITQRLNDGYIDLFAFARDVLQINAQTISKYVNTFAFMSIVSTHDDNVVLPNIVYLIKLEDNIFKIGRTFDFIQRYKKDIREKADSIIYVTDEVKAEKALKKAFKDAGYTLAQGQEYFHYTNFNDVKALFNSTVEKFKLKSEPNMESVLLKREIGHQTNKKAYIHIKLIPYLVTKYISDVGRLRKVREFVKLVAGQTKNGYYDILYDKQKKTKCSTWTYFGIVCIERDNDHNINASRYYNSFCRLKSIKKKKRINTFFKSKIYLDCAERFPALHPGEQICERNYHNQEQPYLNGTYIHWSLLVAFSAWINAAHLMDIAAILIPMFKKGEHKVSNFAVNMSRITSLIEEELETRDMSFGQPDRLIGGNDEEYGTTPLFNSFLQRFHIEDEVEYEYSVE